MRGIYAGVPRPGHEFGAGVEEETQISAVFAGAFDVPVAPAVALAAWRTIESRQRAG